MMGARASVKCNHKPRLVHELLDVAALQKPAAPAVTDPSGTWNYAETNAATFGYAQWLMANGVSRGSRVVVTAVPDRRVVGLLYACSRIGATFVPLAADSGDLYRQQVLQDCKPALVVDSVDDLPLQGIPQSTDMQHHKSAQSGDLTASDAPALLIYTSGSTGAPKGVICPHPKVLFACTAIAERLRYTRDDVIFCRLPLSFDYGLYQVLLAALAAAQLVLAGPGQDARLLAVVRLTGATVIPLVPALADLLLQLSTRDTRPTHVRLFTNTGEALPRPTVDALRANFTNAKIQLMFGITECKRVAIMEPDADLIKPYAVGRPLTGTTVRILGPNGEPVPPGHSGEIVVSGPHVMDGYWGAPELTRLTFRQGTPGGEVRLHTGDFGRLDEAGYLYFDGRNDDIFKSNGVRTSVQEIEAAARDIPEVTDAALVSPDGTNLAVIFAVTSLTPGQVLRALRTRLGPLKSPAACHVLRQLPRSSNGKIDRGALRRDLESQ